MENLKYFNDIKQFVNQFKTTFDHLEDLNIEGEFKKVMLCGMGGSSFYTQILNDILNAYDCKIRIQTHKSYFLPSNSSDSTFYIASSYSGNTEETISSYSKILENNFNHFVLASGGKLLEMAQQNNSQYYTIPAGLQPRLSTGYYIAALLRVLIALNLPDNDKLLQIKEQLENLQIVQDENIETGKALATKIKGKLPIVYSTFNIKSISKITKIKFNENSKTQSFSNYFPELNHNEMVGYTNLVTAPFFLIYKSKFTLERNKKRIEIFKDIMVKKQLPVVVIEPKGDNVIQELFNLYNLADFTSYYLAVENNMDPEPVDLVEEFKEMLK